jgi:2-methylcitrate dehydratase PrpD
MELSRALCSAAARLNFDKLPSEVVDRIKLFLVDTFGVIRGATDAPGIATLNRRMEKWETSGSATALISNHKLSPPSAALVNGAAAHALDYDDQHDPARVHTNCVMLPVLLATAEDLGNVSGERFLLAMAIGAELHARLGLACHKSLGWGWHPTMVLGTLAGAIAAGRLLELSEEGLQNALGMGFHQASGSAQSMRDGVLSKRLGAGFAARAAVLAAFLAADGLTGTRRTLEGSAGLIALYERGEFDVDELMDGLGTDWRILDYSLKPYPCCRATHTVIGLGLQCRREGVRPEQLAEVEIGLGEFNFDAVGRPYEPARNDVVHAQFNASYAFARALCDGRIDFSSFRKSALSDRDIVRLTSISTAINDPQIEPAAIHPARVTLTMKDGTVREMCSATMKGSPDDPMSRDEVFDKFHACVDAGLSGSNHGGGEAMLAAVDRLESSLDIARTLVDAFPR